MKECIVSTKLPLKLTSFLFILFYTYNMLITLLIIRNSLKLFIKTYYFCLCSTNKFIKPILNTNTPISIYECINPFNNGSNSPVKFFFKHAYFFNKSFNFFRIVRSLIFSINLLTSSSSLNALIGIINCFLYSAEVIGNINM